MKDFESWVRIVVAFGVLAAIFMGIGYAVNGCDGLIGGLSVYGVLMVGGIIYAFITSGNETKTIHAENGDWIYLDNIKMTSSITEKVFNYYKKMILENKLRFDDILKNVDLRREYHQIQKIENALPDDNDLIYIDALHRSFSGFSDNAVPDGIILNPQEKCLFSTNSVELKTIQRICTNYSYSGFRYSDGGFRYGSITMHPTQVEGLKHYGDGELILTNQRIIFKGNNMKTKTIPIGTIMGIENFENNGIIIFLSNRDKPIVVKFLADKRFFYNKVHNIAFFYNDLNNFYYYFDKVLYERLEPKEIQEARKEADELNKLIARKNMIAEGLEEENPTLIFGKPAK